MAKHDQPSRRAARPIRPYLNKDGTVKGDPEYHGKTINVTVSMYAGDAELVSFLTEFLGSSRSDAIRTAVRAFAALCQDIDNRSRRKRT